MSVIAFAAESVTNKPSYVGIYIAAALTAGLGVIGWLLRDTVANLRGLRAEQATQSTALAVLVERTETTQGDHTTKLNDHETRLRRLEGHPRLIASLGHAPETDQTPA